MRLRRHLFIVLALAFALALGQYAGLLHGLGHATEQLSQKPGTPAKVACDQCFACSQLSSGAPSTVPVCAGSDAQEAQHGAPLAIWHLVSRVVFHSRGPPVLS